MCTITANSGSLMDPHQPESAYSHVWINTQSINHQMGASSCCFSPQIISPGNRRILFFAADFLPAPHPFNGQRTMLLFLIALRRRLLLSLPARLEWLEWGRVSIGSRPHGSLKCIGNTWGCQMISTHRFLEKSFIDIQWEPLQWRITEAWTAEAAAAAASAAL